MNDYSKMHKQNQQTVRENNDTTVVAEEPIKKVREIKGMVVHCHAVNIRKEPSKDGDILGVAKEDERLIIIDHINGWVKINTKTGMSGYAMDEYIREV